MPCDENRCEDMIDSKIESVMEYIDDEIATVAGKIEEGDNYVMTLFLEHDTKVIKKIHEYYKGKIKKWMLIILPPLVFLLILAMIL